MNKSYIKKGLSFFKLLSLFEKINFHRQKFKNKGSNNEFRINNPDIVLPPDFYLYETFALNYQKVYYGGLDTAKWIVNHFEKYINFEDKNILDWGCGTGRVLRHLSKLVNNTNEIYGTDYNKKYVDWCKNNIEKIEVTHNLLNPPLIFEDNFFDAVYGISIFTHLSFKSHKEWIEELNRILVPNGILLLTTHGNCFREKLSSKEVKDFNRGKLIEHEYKVEGNRLYASYQSPLFFENLCIINGFKILEHIDGETINNKPQQDVWILQKINQL